MMLEVKIVVTFGERYDWNKAKGMDGRFIASIAFLSGCTLH